MKTGRENRPQKTRVRYPGPAHISKPGAWIRSNQQTANCPEKTLGFEARHEKFFRFKRHFTVGSTGESNVR